MKKYLGPRAKAMNAKLIRAANKKITKLIMVKRFARVPIRGVSKRMTKLRRLYLQMRNEWISGKTCAVHGTKCRSIECHHVRGRAGTLMIDKRFWMAVCSGGHAWIHSEMADAKSERFIEKWGQAPRDAETRRLQQIMKELTR